MDEAPEHGWGGGDGGGGFRAGDGGSTFWWWFSLNRENGGPAYHFHQHAQTFPFAGYFNNVIISILVFIFPLALCFVLLPSARSRNWSKLLVVLLCFGTGFLLTVVFGSSCWLVGKVEVNMSVGPQKPPVHGTLGVLAGLWHLYINYATDAFTFTQRVDWSSREDLVAVHKKALNDGWPWALVTLTAELSGEGTAWRGKLGDCLRLGGLAAASFMVTAITLWAVWVLLFIVYPQATGLPIMLSGVVLASCSVAYVVCVSWCMPDTLTVAGTKMELSVGYAWWVVAGLGLCLTLVGLGLLLYDIYYPGRLATVFELEFDIPNQQMYYWSEESLKTPKWTGDVACEEEAVPTLSSTLSDGQTHTTYSPPPDTLRRRSPDQSSEQRLQASSQEQNISPSSDVSEAAFTRTTTSIPNNHSTLLVERHLPKTNALLRTNSLRRSVRSFCRVKPRLSIRLSFRSVLRRKSRSLSRLTLPSMANHNGSEEDSDGKDDQWVEEDEEPELKTDVEFAASMESATRL